MEAVRILAVADEVDPVLTPERLRRLAPDVIVSCGDLPFDYLDRVTTEANALLVSVPGNHDPVAPGPARAIVGAPGLRSLVSGPAKPQPGLNLDGRIAEAGGLLFAGLGGAVRYREGPNLYTQRQMRRRALGLELRARLRRPRRSREGRGRLDVLVAHAPPLGLGDDDDPAHRGFSAFLRLARALRPRLLIHGHIHPYGRHLPDRRIGDTRVINAVPHRLLEVERWREREGGERV